MVVCLNCGNKYKLYASDSRKFVTRCPKCSIQFDDNTRFNILRKFKSGELWKKK